MPETMCAGCRVLEAKMDGIVQRLDERITAEREAARLALEALREHHAIAAGWFTNVISVIAVVIALVALFLKVRL